MTETFQPVLAAASSTDLEQLLLGVLSPQVSWWIGGGLVVLALVYVLRVRRQLRLAEERREPAVSVGGNNRR